MLIDGNVTATTKTFFFQYDPAVFTRMLVKLSFTPFNLFSPNPKLVLFERRLISNKKQRVFDVVPENASNNAR